ncbi:MAG TPA: ATP-binding protein [Candidatus Woesebacteria bacterium]|nr:ATP-binding protein [Candidatus Woesebacteria bacterium]
MKKFFSILSFLALVVLTVYFRLELINLNAGYGAFVFLLLLIILTSLCWGFFAGVVMLFVNAGLIAYTLEPTITNLTQTEIRQLGLFILEGLVILLLIFILKKSREQEYQLREKFQVILSSIGDGVIATDKEGKITYMNAMAQKLTDWKFHDAQKKQLHDIFDIEEDSSVKSFSESVEAAMYKGKQLVVNRPMSIKNKRGKIIDIQDSIAPLSDTKGHTIGVVIIFKDISQQKDLEAQKELLLGSISHELKNYITSIQGYSHIVQKKVLTTNNEQLISFSEKLTKKIESMKDMVLSMLDLSKLDVGKLDLHIEPFDIEELIRNIISDLNINTKHMLRMKGALDVYVEADRIRIGQVLTNLISNAIKYSPEEKEIIITVHRKDMDVIVGVKDFGRGIPKEKLEKIFNPFYRAGNDREKKIISGSGLGLYISREIITQNGGDIWVKSEEGEGSTFYFSLPAIITEETIVQHTPSFIDKLKSFVRFTLLSR